VAVACDRVSALETSLYCPPLSFSPPSNWGLIAADTGSGAGCEDEGRG